MKSMIYGMEGGCSIGEVRHYEMSGLRTLASKLVDDDKGRGNQQSE